MAHTLDIKLNAKVTGTGIPFLWGHGLTMNMQVEDVIGIFDWIKVAESVELVRYDARGHGKSEATYSADDYHWVNLGMDMLALADKMGFAQFMAGGQSMGCATALFSAFLEPDRIRGLVLVNPPTAWEMRASQTSLYEQMAQLIEAKGVAAFVDLMRQRPPIPAWQVRERPELVDIFLEAALSFEPELLAQIMRGANCNLPDRDKLHNLTMPTLILAWPDDPTHPIETAKELHRLLPNSRLIVSAHNKEVETWSQEIHKFLIEVATDRFSADTGF